MPIEEGHPALERAPDELLPSSAVQSELDKSTIDLGKILQRREEAPSYPKSRTTSDAPKPALVVNSHDAHNKSRAISDVSGLDWKRTRKPTSPPPKISKETKKKPPQSLPSSQTQYLSPPKPKPKKPLSVKVYQNETKTTDDAIPEEVWTPVDTQDEPRLRTTSDVTHTNWSKYGKIQTPQPSMSRLPQPQKDQSQKLDSDAPPTKTQKTEKDQGDEF